MWLYSYLDRKMRKGSGLHLNFKLRNCFIFSNVWHLEYFLTKARDIMQVFKKKLKLVKSEI